MWCRHVVTSQLQSEGFHGQQGSYYKSKTKIKTSSVLDLSSVMLTEPEQQEWLPETSLSKLLCCRAAVIKHGCHMSSNSGFSIS